MGLKLHVKSEIRVRLTHTRVCAELWLRDPRLSSLQLEAQVAFYSQEARRDLLRGAARPLTLGPRNIFVLIADWLSKTRRDLLWGAARPTF